MTEGSGPDSTATRRAVLGTSAGVAAAVLTGFAGSVAAQEEGGEGMDGPQTYTVAMTDDLVFDPADITISPGDTLVWRNVGAVGHSVTAYENEIPDDAAYFASGGFDSEEAARSGYPEGDIPGGETYEHTFETEGEYGYFCIPHESAGMTGTITVEPGGAPSTGGESGGSVTLPGGPVGIAFVAVGLGLTGLAVLSVFAGEAYGAVRGEPGSGPWSARLAALAAGVVGFLFLVAMVVVLLAA